MLRQFENSGVGREFVKHEKSSSDVPIPSSANSETELDSDDTYLQNAIVGSDSLRVNNNKSTGETPINNSSALYKVNGKSSDITKFQVPDEETKFSMSQNVQKATQQSNNKTFSSFENQIENYDQDHETQHLPEGSAVPSSRIARAFGFASLGAGLAMGTVAELARRTLGNGSNKNDSLVLSNDANAQRLSNSLRRMRGAAMKLGQMLSIQDESIAPPALTNALAQVRKGAEAMPTHQLISQLDNEWVEGWKNEIELEERPFAAASIGQVHRGTLLSARDCAPKKVAVKVQYPGVADSIESDLANLSMLVKATGLAPPGLFLDNVIRVGREELKVECDYLREMENHKRFQQLISSDSILAAEKFVVPEVYEELCTKRILVTEYVRGGTIDKVVDLSQTERNRIGRAILRLTMLELFVWRFMQTDPNWGNFLYDVGTCTTYLIDFGAAREYDNEFVRGYLNIVIANANRDEASLMEESIRMGFLTGEENDTMLEAHKLSGFCLGEPFQSYEPYDFKASRITSRISEHGSVFLKHRLT
jgi:aarF domain-containing kinase